MISNSINLCNYEFEIRRHAFIRAIERGVTPDMIEATLKGGKIIRHGKNRLKFLKRYKRFCVICIDEVCGTKIKIVTIETSV
jgi:hypothetical protein